MRRLGIIAELCYGHSLVVGLGFGGPCWAESKGGERAQMSEVGMAQLSGLVIGGSNALWVEVLRDREQRELYGEVGVQEMRGMMRTLLILTCVLCRQGWGSLDRGESKVFWLCARDLERQAFSSLDIGEYRMIG